ncbi:GTP-binding protein [Sinanaerobacter chloroacetimidivorans]|nr:GTP-binding protein [Sinanaerobacter chloroacetimidivorans]
MNQKFSSSEFGKIIERRDKMARIIFVGGFLGAGKTTLLGEISKKLTENGRCVGLITNDQASELVDTALLKRTSGFVAEVSGSCFCCNFEGLMDAVSHMNSDKQVDYIIAEPVGSCTDLSATILQPLKEKMKEDLAIAPLSVLIDPIRLSDILDGETSGLHSSAAYIIRKQLEEADIILISKVDLIEEEDIGPLKKRAAREWPLATVLTVSAARGDGLEQWLEEVTRRQDAGNHLAEVDYDIYAEGEAVLGWLNATVELQSENTDWDHFKENFLHSLSRRFDRLNATVGHVKVFVETDQGGSVGNLTGKEKTLSLRGTSGGGLEAKMTLNARVELSPEKLEEIVKEEMRSVCGSSISSKFLSIKCLSPGRPNPTYRYDRIIG